MPVTIPASFALVHPLEVTLVKGNGEGETGQTVVVAIRDTTTDDSYLDWDDLTFKTVGWGTRQKALAEVGGGHYTLTGGVDPWLWTPRPDPPAYFQAEFEVTTPKKGVGADLIVITDALPGEEFERELDETGDDVLGWQEVHTNAASREIRRFNLYDENGVRITGTATAFKTAGGIIARRDLV